MKYDNISFGQMKALINKIGGESVFRAILSDNRNIVPTHVEDVQRVAFMQSLEKCLATRNLLRGLDCYQSVDGVIAFRILVSQVAERASNLAQIALSNNSQIDEQFRPQMLQQIHLALRKVIEFEIRDGTLLEFAKSYLYEIERSLIEENRLGVLKNACSLKGFLQGVERLNDSLLAKVDLVRVEVRNERDPLQKCASIKKLT